MTQSFTSQKKRETGARSGKLWLFMTTQAIVCQSEAERATKRVIFHLKEKKLFSLQCPSYSLIECKTRARRCIGPKNVFFFFFQRVLRCCFLELHVSFSLQNTSARAGKAGALCRRLEPGVQYCLMKDRAGLVALGAEAIRNDVRTWVAPFYLTIASDSCPDLIAVGRKKRTCSRAC